MGFLYYGSTARKDFIEKKDVVLPIGVDPKEAGKAIYLVDDEYFAIACGGRPDIGVTIVDHKHRTIRFSHPSVFYPRRAVYVYTVDPRFMGEGFVTQVDEHIFAVSEDVEAIVPIAINVWEADDVKRRYKVIS